MSDLLSSVWGHSVQFEKKNPMLRFSKSYPPPQFSSNFSSKLAESMLILRNTGYYMFWRSAKVKKKKKQKNTAL